VIAAIVDTPLGGGDSVMAERVVFGRLMRVGTRRAEETRIFVVAEPEPVAAAAILRAEFGRDIETEDLGRVTAALLTALNLEPGEVTEA
jgi:hypothetical protein